LSEHGDVIEMQTTRIVSPNSFGKLGPWYIDQSFHVNTARTFSRPLRKLL